MAQVKQVINISGAPKLPFSPAVRAGDFIFVSGQGGTRDEKGLDIKTFDGQARQCLENVKRILEAGGASLDDVVKVTVFLRNGEDFLKMNEIYRSYFTRDLPARSTVVTGLVYGPMLIEIECIAYKPL